MEYIILNAVSSSTVSFRTRTGTLSTAAGRCITTTRTTFFKATNVHVNDKIEVWAQEPCPGGGKHISPVHSFTATDHFLNNYPWWGGTFQLGGGCVT